MYRYTEIAGFCRKKGILIGKLVTVLQSFYLDTTLPI